MKELYHNCKRLEGITVIGKRTGIKISLTETLINIIDEENDITIAFSYEQLKQICEFSKHSKIGEDSIFVYLKYMKGFASYPLKKKDEDFLRLKGKIQIINGIILFTIDDESTNISLRYNAFMEEVMMLLITAKQCYEGYNDEKRIIDSHIFEIKHTPYNIIGNVYNPVGEKVFTTELWETPICLSGITFDDLHEKFMDYCGINSEKEGEIK